MEFWKFYRLVKARRWMILGLLLITLFTVAVAWKAVQDNNQYTATAVVEPNEDAMSPSGVFQDNGHSLVGPTYTRLDRIALFAQSLQSQFDSAVALARESGVDQKRAIVSALISQIPTADGKRLFGKNWKVGSPATTVKNAPESDLDATLGYFHIPTDPSVWVARSDQELSDSDVQQMKANMAAQPIYNTSISTGTDSPGLITDMLQASVQSSSPALAEQLVNLMAISFISNYQQQGQTEYDNSIQAVQAAQHQARQQFNDAEAAYFNFKRQNQFVEVSTSVSEGVTNLAGLEGSLERAQQDLSVAQRSVATYTQLYTQLGPTQVTPLSSLARPQVQQLEGQIADDKAAIEQMQGQVTDVNPTMIHAKEALKAKEDELQNLKNTKYVTAAPSAEYQQLRQQADAAKAEAARDSAMIASLNTQIAQQKQQNVGLPAAEEKLAQLQEDLSTAQINKQKADDNVASITGSIKTLNRGLIALRDPATDAAPDQSGPGLTSLLIYGAILSLIIGITVAIGLDYLDNSVQTIPDAEKLLGMPVSAVIPAMPAGDLRRMARLTVSDPLSPVAEAYRLLRTDLLFTAEEKPFQSLMAATAKPGQGATTTICNLAVALATVGKRVILIDADLRRPKLHAFFNVSNDTGLTSLLRDECEMEEALKVTDIDNLLVLPSGPLPLNPSELLASQKMRALHERLKPHTDFVLVDTPSAIAFSDASILASYLDAVMIVVRAQETPRGSEIQLKNLLNKARANVVGVVLNGVKPHLVDSYFYHAAYYPQVSPGHALGVANGGILPPPNGTNGYHGNGHGSDHQTLEGDTDDSDGSGTRSSAQNIEATAIMDDDLVQVTPQARKRFSIRKMFGQDNRDE